MTSNVQAAPDAPPSIPTPVARQAPAYVVIKADDLRAKGKSVDARWQKFVDFAHQRKIKVGIGIIADSLESDNAGYFDWIQKQRDDAGFEQFVGIVDFLTDAGAIFVTPSDYRKIKAAQ